MRGQFIGWEVLHTKSSKYARLLTVLDDLIRFCVIDGKLIGVVWGWITLAIVVSRRGYVSISILGYVFRIDEESSWNDIRGNYKGLGNTKSGN